jgi:hypothetical protein
MFITVSRINSRHQQDFMQTGQAELRPVYQMERSAIIVGKMVYQDLNQAPGFNNFEQAVQNWNRNGGANQPKILTSLLTLTDGQPTQVGRYTNYFMVRMQGYIRLNKAGTWIMYANQDDYLAVRFGTATGQHIGPSGSQNEICTYQASSGGWVEFDMVFQENGGNQYYGFWLQGPDSGGMTELQPAEVGYSQNLLAKDFTY